MNKASERTPNDTDHLSGALNTRSRIFTTIKRSEDHKGYAKTTLELNRFIRQGSNQLQPKDRSAPTEQILIDRFETIESEDDLILRDKYGHPVGLKRKVPFRAKKNGDLVKGELFTPFTVQSSSVETGYQDSLKKAGLWGEVADRLADQATGLSGGQQQRLCIARAIAVGPDVLLMDEPCSALDPIATSVIEELISELRQRFTILIVTHSMQQAARVSQKTAYFHLGTLVEYGDTKEVFTLPKNEQTEAYISGKIG
mgnify:CR=1 FL=1